MIRALSLPEQRLTLVALAALVGGLLVADWRQAPTATPASPAAAVSPAALPGLGLEPAELLESPARAPAAPIMTSVSSGRVDINTADVSLLETLPGIGPVKAKAIVDDRATRGPFSSVDDLDRVTGFGEKTVARLRPYLAAGSSPPVAGVAPPQAAPRSTAASAAPSVDPSTARLNINIATVAELETLDGIGPKLAQRIVDDRNRLGPFRSVGELERVTGVGPAIMTRNRHRLAVQ